jgi:hypothetical protein
VTRPFAATAACAYGATANDGYYEIVRQLPDERGELQYRIKSVREPHDRVVKESDLEAAGSRY